MDSLTVLEDYEMMLQLENCNVEVVQIGTGRIEAEDKARLVNQPMGSNFDGNCN
jgi:hypothetical protein